MRRRFVTLAAAALTATGAVALAPHPARADGTAQPAFAVGSFLSGALATSATGPLGTFFTTESGSTVSIFRGGPSPTSDGTVTISGLAQAALVPPGATTPLLLAAAIPAGGASPDTVALDSQRVDGTFVSAALFSGIGTGLNRLAQGDVTGDGDPDLVLASLVSSTVVLRTVSHPDSSARVVSTPVTVPDLTSVYDITVADVTGDGRPDVLLVGPGAGGRNELVVVHNVNGALTSAGADAGTRAGTMAVGVAVGDVNGDGRPDVAYGGSTGVAVRFGQPGGSLGPSFPLAPPAGDTLFGLAAGDLNGDGITDVVAVDDVPGGLDVDVALGTAGGPGAWTTIPGSVVGTGGSGSFLVANLSGDGRNDIYASGLGELLRNVSPAGAAAPGSLALGSQRVSTVGPPVPLTFTNNGQGRIYDGSVAVSGPNAADFLVAQNGCAGVVVPVGGSCTVAVRYAPSVEGAETATLHLTSADLPASAGVVALTGTGTAAPQVGPGPAGPVGARGPAGTPAAVIPYLAVVQPAKVYVAGAVRAYVASSATGSLVVQTLRGRTLVGTRTVALHAGIHVTALTLAPKTAGTYTLRLTTVVRGAAATSATTSLVVVPKPKPAPKKTSKKAAKRR